MRLVLPFAAALLLAGPACGATHARITLVRDSPATIQGRGFRPHEQIRVVIVMDSGRWSRLTTAGARGGFLVAFRGVRIRHCAVPLQISARGTRTGRVVAVLPLWECAAP